MKFQYLVNHINYTITNGIINLSTLLNNLAMASQKKQASREPSVNNSLYRINTNFTYHRKCMMNYNIMACRSLWLQNVDNRINHSLTRQTKFFNDSYNN